MPGRSVRDFEEGQWVGFTDERTELFGKGLERRVNPVVDIAAHSGLEFVRIEYLHTGEKHIGGFDAGNLLTAEETEELLYHCSYCGKEGHNRRTCLELAKHSGKHFPAIEEVDVYKKGSTIDGLFLGTGDLFAVTRRGDSHSPFNKATFKFDRLSSGRIHGTVVDNGGETSVGVFGKSWNFLLDSWEIHEVLTDKIAASEKKEPVLSTWRLIEEVLPATRLILLYGPPGTGKTTAGNYLGNPELVSNITLTEETPAAELRGHFIPKGNEFVWMDGPALTEFKRGGRLVLNEIDKASGDALTFCHALLDDPGIARITLPYSDAEGNPVTVTPGASFNVVATMNGEPEDLPEALRDRFAVRIHVDKVHPDAIKSLPKDLQKIASKGIAKERDRGVSIRGWNAFVILRDAIGEVNAARAVFGDSADTILNTIRIDNLKTKKD